MYYPRVREAIGPDHDAAAADPPGTIDAVIHALFTLMRPSAPPPGGQGAELTMSQLRVLFRLRHNGPATMGEIARFAACSLQSATALIERVERKDLVIRDRREDDRRVVECSLTDPGRALVDAIAGHRAASIRAALATLHPDELAQLDGLLRAMLERQGRAAP